MKKKVFPFTAIVGQERIKKALILNAINPSIGGVLIKGDRGTGKTTGVRALANLLPEIEVVEDCPFNSDEDAFYEFELYKVNDKSSEDEIVLVKKPMKVVELPLGATEDRVIGSLDIEKALHEGIKALEPGLLARANSNILYVDEINLLDDNLVDILLDAAAFGVNTIEREGISISHPSNFILVGTMNPEEGELRGQLSDRIGLKISVTGIDDIGERIEIIKRIDDFEENPNDFIDKYADKEEELQKKITEGRKILPSVRVSDDYIEIIARISKNLGVEGHRSDIAILKTAKTIAAFNGRLEVEIFDLEEAILLVLGEISQCDSEEKAQNQIQKAQNQMNQDKDENENENENEDDSDDDNQDQIGEDSFNNDNFDGTENFDDSGDFDNSDNFDDSSNTLDNEYNEYNGDNNNIGNNIDDMDNDEGQGNDETLENDYEDNEDNIDDTDDDGNEQNNENQFQGEAKDSNQSDDEYQVDSNENKAEMEFDEFDMESLEKDIRKMLVMEGREKEKVYGSHVESKSEKGKYVKSKYSQNISSSDIAIDATLRAAAMRSKNKDLDSTLIKSNNFNNLNKNNSESNNNFNNLNNINNNINKNNNKNNNNNINNNINNLNKSNGLKINVKNQDIREKVRKHKARASVVVVVDMSGSMINEKKVNKIRGILEKLIKNINRNRDKLAVIGFKGQKSEIIIPNTKRPSSFLDKLDKITVGGTTPMAAGLEKALEILKNENKKGEFIPMLVLLSDGMPNIGLNNSYIKKTTGNPVNDVLAMGDVLGEEGIYTVVIDFEKKHKQGRNINMELAYLSNGRYYDLENIYNPDIAIDKILTYERAVL